MFGDYAYDLEPIDLNGMSGWGDMAYDVVPAPDPFNPWDGIGELELLDGWGDTDEGYEGYGAVRATAQNLARLRTRRYKLKQKLKYRKRKKGPWSRASARKAIRSIDKKIRKLKARARRQHAKGKKTIFGRRTRLRRLAKLAPSIRLKIRSRKKARRYVRVGTSSGDYTPISPEVSTYEPSAEPEEEYEAIEPETESYTPIRPPVERYETEEEEEEEEERPRRRRGIRYVARPIRRPPLASEAASRYAPVVRLRQVARPGAVAAAYQRPGPLRRRVEEEDEDLDGWGELELLDGFGDYDDDDDFDGYGVVGTAKNLIRLRGKRRRLRLKLKAGMGNPATLQNRIGRLTEKIQRLKRRVHRQVASRRGAGRRLRPRHRRLAKLMRIGGGPSAPGVAPSVAAAAQLLGPIGLKMRGRGRGRLIARMRARGWARPPARFRPRMRPARRWRLWNKRRGRMPGAPRRFIPIRPRVAPYRRLAPPVAPYMRAPGPPVSFTPIRPRVAPYRPAPMPAIPSYVPAVGRRLPTSYTYTHAARRAQAQAQFASRASEELADRSVEQEEDAEGAEEESGKTMKVALFIALAAGGVWFLNKRKKAGKKTAKKPAVSSAFV